MRRRTLILTCLALGLLLTTPAPAAAGPPPEDPDDEDEDQYPWCEVVQTEPPELHPECLWPPPL